MANRKKRVSTILVVIIMIVAIVAFYFTFLYSKKCSDISCFNAALSECRKVSYLNDAKDAAWFYKIKGKRGEQCEIKVKLLKLKEGSTDLLVLEGKEMNCFLPLGSIVSPQENLARCTGPLKEEMQGVIIKRLHNYIVDNLGEISEELTKAV